MYDIGEAREIYHDINCRMIGFNHPELEPYQGILRSIFYDDYLYKKLDPIHSTEYVNEMIDFVTSHNITDDSLPDFSFSSCFYHDHYALRMAHFKTMLAPSLYSKEDPVLYCDCFHNLFRHAKKMLVMMFKVSHINGFYDLVDNYIKTFGEEEKEEREEDFLFFATGYYFANQDKYDINVLNEIYRDCRQYVEHLTFNSDAVRERDDLRFLQDEELEKVYRYIENVFENIKANIYQNIIK